MGRGGGAPRGEKVMFGKGGNAGNGRMATAKIHGGGFEGRECDVW
jgi:hypothetical protein